MAALSGDLDCDGITGTSMLSLELAENDSVCSFSRIVSASSMIAVTVFSLPSILELISGRGFSFANTVERSFTFQKNY